MSDELSPTELGHDLTASLSAWLQAGGQGETDQLGEAARHHPVHQPRRVDVDGARADFQIVGDRFVGQPARGPRKT